MGLALLGKCGGLFSKHADGTDAGEFWTIDFTRHFFPIPMGALRETRVSGEYRVRCGDHSKGQDVVFMFYLYTYLYREFDFG